MYTACESYQVFLRVSLVPMCPLLCRMCSFSPGGGWEVSSAILTPQPQLGHRHSWRCPTERDAGFGEGAARARVKAQQSRSESFQGSWDVKCSWVSLTTAKWVLLPYSPGALLDVYQLHPSFPPAISTYSVAKGDEIRSPPSSFRNLSHLPHWVGTCAVG